MSITKSIPVTTLGASFEVALTGLDRTDLTVGSTEPTAQGGSETTYRFIAGDADHLSTVRIGDYPPAKAGAAYNKSVKLSTWSKEVNSVSGEEVWKRISATVATSDESGNGIVDPSDFLALIMMCVSAWIPGAALVTFEPSEAAVTLSAYGVSDFLHVTP